MRPVRSAVGVLATLVLVGCQAASDAPLDAEPVLGVDRIDMHDRAFDPPVVQVPAGTTVTWAFTDGGTRHNVVGDGFESEVASDGTFTHTFARPGTYDYTCTLHSGMDGRVIATDA
ncbi:MAG TPA: plastocyanin/azurin family copper-binding protein [Egibacteraceae bacterium]|nr:plastocyanin/azurin family copper-binding protein [Egibacteraceae bacterium]